MRLRAPRIRWARLAALVRHHPVRVLALSTLLLAVPAAAAGQTRLTYNILSELPSSADSVAGFDALSRHFTRGEIGPVMVVVDAGESLWNDEAFRAVNDLTIVLGKVPGVAAVRSLTQPTAGSFDDEDLAGTDAEGLTAFPDRLDEGAGGVAQVIDGLERIRGGLVAMRERLPELAGGLREGAAGLARARDGIAQMRDGLERMRDGLSEAATALTTRGEDNDLADLAEAAAARAHDAFENLFDDALPTSKADPAVQRAMENIGTAYGALTGRHPVTNEPPPGDAAAERYAEAGGMAGSLRTIGAGLRAAVAGIDRIDAGLAEMDDGLGRLADGLREGAAGTEEAVDGAARMIEGLDRIIPGLRELRAGLAEGAASVRAAGFGDPEVAGNLGLTPSLVEALGVRDRLAFFLSDDETTTRLLVTLEDEPYASRSINAVAAMREAGALALNDTPLEGTPLIMGGAAAFFEDIRTLSQADFGRIMAIVLFGIFLVLVVLLRSIVAPVYLIGTVLLSFISTLGITVLVFQGLLGAEGVQWWLPPFLFVMLVALGVDYNILLVSRVREEAAVRTTAAATERALTLTGPVITSAGLILAGTFAALLAAPLRSMQQFGFAFTVGILLDTFVVRSLLVPSIATLLGRHNWWPSRRASAP